MFDLVVKIFTLVGSGAAVLSLLMLLSMNRRAVKIDKLDVRPFWRLSNQQANGNIFIDRFVNKSSEPLVLFHDYKSGHREKIDPGQSKLIKLMLKPGDQATYGFSCSGFETIIKAVRQGKLSARFDLIISTVHES